MDPVVELVHVGHVVSGDKLKGVWMISVVVESAVRPGNAAPLVSYVGNPYKLNALGIWELRGDTRRGQSAHQALNETRDRVLATVGGTWVDICRCGQ
jgi:hypothetical protein